MIKVTLKSSTLVKAPLMCELEDSDINFAGDLGAIGRITCTASKVLVDLKGVCLAIVIIVTSFIFSLQCRSAVLRKPYIWTNHSCCQSSHYSNWNRAGLSVLLSVVYKYQPKSV